MFGINPYAILGALGAVLAAAVLGFAAGHHLSTLQVKAAEVAQLNATVVRVQKAAQATSAIDHKSAAAQAAISAITAANLEKVRAYVPRKADDQCIVGVGAVRLLDAAALGVTVPAAPGDGLQAADSGVALSDLVADGVANAGSYHTLAERLNAWDQWYDAHAANAAGRKPPADPPPPT